MLFVNNHLKTIVDNKKIYIAGNTLETCLFVNNNINRNELKYHRCNNDFDTLVEDKIKLTLIKIPILVQNYF